MVKKKKTRKTTKINYAFNPNGLTKSRNTKKTTDDNSKTIKLFDYNPEGLIKTRNTKRKKKTNNDG